METKARYFLIGLFTLAGLFGSMAFLLWLAKVEVDLQYAYYDVLFENVTGLGNAGDVRYNGLLVGRVVDLRLDQDNSDRVRVRIEVNADTPVKTDTVAVLQGQGVTGVSFVALQGGSADAALLPENSVIKAEPSPWQSVLEGAPELLQRATMLLEDINQVVDDQNREAVTRILDNLASASGRLDTALGNFETLSTDLSQAAGSIAGFATRLDTLADTAEVTLNTATNTLVDAQSAISQGETALATADTTLRTMDDTFAAAQTLIEGDIAEFARRGSAVAENIDTTLDTLRTPALDALNATTSALSEAESTFA
ncbi:MAG: MlaD family protein, partial [Pseudomonadota bacterium]